MKWLAVAVGVTVLLVAVVMVVGSLLPERHSATVERRVAGPPADVWAVITAPEAFPDWRPGVESVERLADRDGRAAWVERSRHGPLTMEVVEADAPRRLVTRIADEDLPFGGTWTFRLEPDVGGTRVTITEDGVIHSALFRFVSRFVTGYEGTMRTYLDGLEARMAGTS